MLSATRLLSSVRMEPEVVSKTLISVPLVLAVATLVPWRGS